MKDSKKPVLFYQRYFYCFSNFSSFKVEWKGVLWMTSEHAYQAAKFNDEKIVKEIRESISAHDSKKTAHKYRDLVREDWDDIKLKIMEKIIEAKLAQHSFIQKRLKETKNREIIEDSSKDSFWGWGPDKKGENHLGKIWMKLRDETSSHNNQ